MTYHCPACGRLEPHKRPDNGDYWRAKYAHRCPHGEPCGVSKVSCQACRERDVSAPAPVVPKRWDGSPLDPLGPEEPEHPVPLLQLGHGDSEHERVLDALPEWFASRCPA